MSNATNATNDGHVDPYVAMLTSPTYLLHLFGVGPFILGMLAFLWSLLFYKVEVEMHKFHHLYNELTQFITKNKSERLSPNRRVVKDHSESTETTYKNELCTGTTYFYLNPTKWRTLSWAIRHDTIRERGPNQSTVTVRTFRWNRALLDTLMQERSESEKPAGIYSPNDNYWSRKSINKKRPYIPTQTFQQIEADVQEFMKPETRKRYNAKGKPYKRGYMMHSRPGSWKTSFVMHMCRKFNMNLHVIKDWTKVKDFDSLITDMLHKTRVSVLCFEDFDKRSLRGAGDRETKGEDTEHQMQIVIQSLLDGVDTPDNLIVIFLTNFPDMIPKSMRRPGRIDMTVECTHRDCIVSAFRHFYPGVDTQVGKTLADRLAPLSYDTGVVAEKLDDLHQEKTPTEMVDFLEQWFKDHPADDRVLEPTPKATKNKKVPPAPKYTDTEYEWVGGFNLMDGF